LSSFEDIWKKTTKEEPAEKAVEKKVTEETVEETTEESTGETTEETTGETVVEETPETPVVELQNIEETTVSAEGVVSEETTKAPEGLWGEETTPEVKHVKEIPAETPAEGVVKKPVAPALPITPVIIDEKSVIVEVEGVSYDLAPDRGGRKIVITDYGLKGEGKTGFAFSFPGRIACLSFDRKSKQVWEEMYNKDQRIVVYDAIRYLNKMSGPLWLKTADKTFKYVMLLLDEVITPTKPDWIVIDGAEIFTQLCEMIMRYRNGLQPFQGIKNLNLWKERRMLIDQLHNKCISIAKEGIIYTTYTRKDEVVEDGQFVTRKDVPKWIDAIMLYTDIVVRVRSKSGKDGRVFTAEIESSKTKKMKTGKIVDITNGGYKNIVGD